MKINHKFKQHRLSSVISLFRYFIGLVFAFFMFSLTLTLVNTAQYNEDTSWSNLTLKIDLIPIALANDETEEEEEDEDEDEDDEEEEDEPAFIFDPNDPRLIGSMKVSMYEYVADDEDITIVHEWIKSGSKQDDVFKNDILPIIKDNCKNCHSTSSEMNKAVRDLPLTTYEEIHPLTKVGPLNDNCLGCHSSDSFKNHSDETFQKRFVDQSGFEASVHQKLLCVKCHFISHKEADDACKKENAFNKFVQLSTYPTNGACSKLNKPKCVTCHKEESDQIQEGVHKLKPDQAQKKTPKCNDCHGIHEIKPVATTAAKMDITNNCGTCHTELIKTYYDTYHGKVAKLGSEKSAKCADCHGAHNILSPVDETSTLHVTNRQKTCEKCHEGATANFVDFKPHANHHDSENYPKLYYSFWAMTWLLIITMLLFGTHTVLWFFRTIIERIKLKDQDEPSVVLDDGEEKQIRRFTLTHTILHLLIIVSFLSLALTGMTLKFPDNGLFAKISELVGGPHNLGLIHRTAAIITFVYAIIHMLQLLMMFVSGKMTIKGMFKEEYTLIPLKRDFVELKQNLLYFVGKGDKPEFGRWTYWEKFDYLAVFWGVTIIGFTGLMLWFPQITTAILPGWTLNVATIIHSDEALLAAAFIFTIHFFNSHMRPENFPMDPTIFTQRMPLSRFKEERPREYQDLIEQGKLDDMLVDPPAKWYYRTTYIFGFMFVIIGQVIIFGVAYSLFKLVF